MFFFETGEKRSRKVDNRNRDRDYNQICPTLPRPKRNLEPVRERENRKRSQQWRHKNRTHVRKEREIEDATSQPWRE
jgi:hypothetical protein